MREIYPVIRLELGTQGSMPPLLLWEQQGPNEESVNDLNYAISYIISKCNICQAARGLTFWLSACEQARISAQSAHASFN